MRRLFSRLFAQSPENFSKAAPPPPGAYGPTPEQAEAEVEFVVTEQAAEENAALADYENARAEHGPVFGTVTIPVSLKAVFLAAGSRRVLSRLTLTPGASNSGTVYVGGLQNSTSSGTPLTKTSTPLILHDVLLGDMTVLGSNAGDVLAWAGS